MIKKKDVKRVPKLRFSGYKDPWRVENVGEIGKVIRGASPRPQGDPRYYGGRVPRLMVKDVTRDGKFVTPNIDFLTEEGAKKSRPCKKGTLTIVCSGTVGIPSILAVDACIHDGFLALLDIHDDISIDFLYHRLSTLQQHFEKSATHGGVFINLTTSLLSDFKIKIPCFQEQIQISSFLDSIRKKIQQLTRKKELLEQYKKGVMQKIFSREIRFKNENGKNYPDWEVKQLSEFLIPTFREVPTPSEHYLAIGIRSHCRGTFQKPYSDPNAIAMEKLFLVRENDLIVNITFAWEGAIAMVTKEDHGGFVSHRFPTYTFDRRVVLNEFFKYVFVQKRFRYTLDLISPGGAGRNRVLSKKELLKIKWTMPLIKEQKKIASFLEIIDKKIENATYQLTQTQQFKKGLLQQLFV